MQALMLSNLHSLKRHARLSAPPLPTTLSRWRNLLPLLLQPQLVSTKPKSLKLWLTMTASRGQPTFRYSTDIRTRIQSLLIFSSRGLTMLLSLPAGMSIVKSASLRCASGTEPLSGGNPFRKMTLTRPTGMSSRGSSLKHTSQNTQLVQPVPTLPTSPKSLANAPMTTTSACKWLTNDWWTTSLTPWPPRDLPEPPLPRPS